MENSLTCNGPKCRKELTDRAVVTTCSHIFCLECVQQIGLASQENQRCTTCPICNAHLAKPEDVAVANLNPTEEYKTCALSGLNPNIIMECAGRAISFWAYQTTQNLHYQQHLYKTLSEKYSTLWARFERLYRDADAEINGATASQDVLQRKHDELAEAFKNNSRKLFQTQELYNKVKRKAELGQIERAASDAVDSSIPSVPQPVVNNQESNTFLSRHFRDNNERSFPLSRGMRYDAPAFSPGLSGSNLQQYERESNWLGKQPQPHGLARGDSMRPSGMNSPSFPQRPNGWAGVGLTSGLKVGQPTNHSGLDGSLRSL
ncbi:hypothetical protein Trco_004240 [Trichoderma cornu-damae]|uniref:RING-type domain-containing protein n=1 Tax=Trichoderma cornu-damae TaxID=654480 RepID=A0A9P8TXB4_9HYPO|nr:hypothetical protein Trco_004240 [Trichoderma cornu-damae]